MLKVGFGQRFFFLLKGGFGRRGWGFVLDPFHMQPQGVFTYFPPVMSVDACSVLYFPNLIFTGYVLHAVSYMFTLYCYLYLLVFQVDNFFVCCGMNGNGVQSGGGMGRVVAEWMVLGGGNTSAQDIMAAFDVKRFIDIHNNRRYLEERTREVVGR